MANLSNKSKIDMKAWAIEHKKQDQAVLDFKKAYMDAGMMQSSEVLPLPIKQSNGFAMLPGEWHGRNATDTCGAVLFPVVDAEKNVVTHIQARPPFRGNTDPEITFSMSKVYFNGKAKPSVLSPEMSYFHDGSGFPDIHTAFDKFVEKVGMCQAWRLTAV
jgi:hypothetical protein